MLRRELLVPPGLLSQEELARREGARPEDEIHVLCDYDDGYGFRLLIPGVLPEPGARAVVYAFDRRVDEELFAVNAAFSSVYYLDRHGKPWPDELRLVEELVPASGAEILEVCCGGGRTAPSLVKEGNRVTAIDLSPECIARASLDRSGVDYRVADATALPFADRSFDLGFCFENSLGVFFSRRSQVVAELIRVSRRLVVLGLREVPNQGEQLQIYATRTGFLEVAQVHDRRSAERIADAAPPKNLKDRIVSRRFADGEPRPWGGREFYLILELR